LISGFISLSLTPMLCSRFLRPAGKESQGKLHLVTELGFKKALGFYEKTLTWALHNKPSVIIVFLLMAVGTAVLFVIIPKGFMPTEDTGQIVCMTEAEQGTSYDAMVKLHTEVCNIISQNPSVQSYMSSIGVGSGSPNLALNQGRILIVLKQRDQRKESVDQVIADLQPQLANITGINTFLQNPPTIAIGGQVTKSLYQFTLSSPDRNQLYTSAASFIELVKGVPGVTDVTSDMQVENPEVHLQVDRDKCSELGITMNQVEDALDSAYAQRQISTMYTPTNQYWVIIEVEPKYYRDPSVINSYMCGPQATSSSPWTLFARSLTVSAPCL
jgi:hydrophobic/amphiphilic exporter-1 (mainly G- bacteria), HAE1 family